MKWSEVDISLNHDVMASFSLHNIPWLPKSGANLASVKVATIWCPYTNGSNTLYMSNMDVWNGLRLISASTMMLWHHFHSSSEPESPNLGQLGRCNGLRVQPYALETAYQWLKHFLYVYYGCMKHYEVDISLNHVVVASFPLLKWTWMLKSGANLASVAV